MLGFDPSPCVSHVFCVSLCFCVVKVLLYCCAGVPGAGPPGGPAPGTPLWRAFFFPSTRIGHTCLCSLLRVCRSLHDQTFLNLLQLYRLGLSDSPHVLFVVAVFSPAAYEAALCRWTSFHLFAVFTLPCFVLKMATVCKCS